MIAPARPEHRGPGGVTCSRRQLLLLGAAVLAVALLLCAASPPRALALNIGPSRRDPLGGQGSILGGVTGGIAKVAVGGFDAIIKALFAPIAKFITTELIGWLVAVPNLTQGNVAALEQTVEAMGGGLLGAVATISTIRYWAAGFAGGGDSGFAALEGLTRTVGAALFLAIWPWLFDTAVSLTNLFTSSLLGSGAVVHSVSHLLAAGLGAGIALNFTPIGLFLNIAMAVAASLLFLGLLLVKIVVSISTILVFIGMPLAVVAWPVVPWIARAAMRAFAVCLLVPVMWALCFAASAAVSLNAISFNASSVMNALLEPLVAIVLLWVMLRLPIHLTKVAMLGAAPLGGGIASRAVSYAAGSQLRDAAQGHSPAGAAATRPRPAAKPGRPRAGPPPGCARPRRSPVPQRPVVRWPARPREHCRHGGWRGRSGRDDRGTGRRCDRGRQRARVHAAADRPSQHIGAGIAERVADAELRRPRAGLRKRDLRGAVPRADQSR